MSLTPSGVDTALTLQQLRRIRGEALAPVPLPDEDEKDSEE